MLRPLVFVLVPLLGLSACGGAAPPSATPGPPLLPEVTLASISPAAAPEGGGVLAQLSGSGFLALDVPHGAFVRIADRAASVEILNDAALRFVVPPGIPVGPQIVELVAGAWLGSLDGAFTIHPDVTCSPDVVAPADEPTRITIRGLDPADPPLISLGGEPLTPIEQGAVRVVVAPRVLPGQVGRQIPLRVRAGLVELIHDVRVVAAVDGADVRISEWLADPGGLDTNRDGTACSACDEFIEIVNRSDTPIDLSGSTLRDGAALRHVFPNPTTLPPGGVLVVFGAGTPTGFAPPHAAGHAQSATTGSLGLNNGSDTIELLGPGGALLDRLDYAGSTPGVSRHAVGGDFEEGVPSPGEVP